MAVCAECPAALRAGQRTIEHDWRIPTANTPQGEAISGWMRASMQLVLDSASAKSKLWPYVMPRIAADDSARAAYDSATAAAFAREAASRLVWFDPTLAVLYTQHRRNEAAIRKPPELKYVPPEGLDSPVLPLVPGFSLQLELELLVGAVEAGKIADLVLLSADPLADIRNTRQITAVILGGRLLGRAALDGLLAQAEAAAAGKP
jgi:hypothetical protein